MYEWRLKESSFDVVSVAGEGWGEGNLERYSVRGETLPLRNKIAV